MKKRKMLAVIMATAIIVTSGCNCDSDVRTDESAVIREEKVLTEEMANAIIPVDGVVTIPDDITVIGEEAFQFRSDITEVIIPDGVTAIDDYAFENCSKLEDIYIPGSVISLGNGVFKNCVSFKEITIPDSVIYVGEELFGTKAYHTVHYKGRSYNSKNDYEELIAIIMGIPTDKNTAQAEAMEYKVIDGTVIVPEGKTEIKPYAFSQRSDITGVSLPEGLLKIGGYAFEKCPNLQTIIIPESVTEICDAAFFECTSLTEIVIPDRITEISNSAFEKCSNLRMAAIPEGISKIGDRAFSGCKKLEEIVIPNSVSEIGVSAFGGCESFKEHIDLRNVRSLGTNAFVASGITGITFSTAIKEIPSMIAASCENLTEVVIPEGVTKIGSEAFTMSNNITSITLPDSIEFIGFNAFPADEKLTITYKNKVYPYNDDTLFYSTFLEAPFTELPDGVTTEDICGMLYYNGKQLQLPFTIDKFMELNESWKYDEEDLNELPYAIFVFEVDETGNLTGNSTFLVTHKSGDLRSEDDVEKFFTLSGIDLGEFSIDKFKIGSSYSDFKAFFGEPGEAYPNSEELIDIEGVDYYYFKDEKRNVRFIVDYLDGKIKNITIITEKRIHN